MPRLTKRTLDAVKPDPARETFVWCSSSPGFGARIYPSGRVVFIAQVRVGRAQRRVKIGAYGPYTVEQARERADEIVRVAAEGRDPQREKQDQKAALTVAELLDAYIEAADAGRVLTRFGRPKKPSTIAIDKGRIERHIKPLIGRLVARDVKASDIQRMADAISDGKTAVTAKSGNKRGKAVVTGGAGTAARVVELLGGVWTWAAKREHVAPLSVTKGVERIKSSPKARALSPAELKSLGAAIRTAEPKDPMAAAALKLLALTGMRRQEAVKLMWSEYDSAGSCLHLGDTKTGRSTRPLGAAAAALLDAWATHGTHPTLVFPNARSATGPPRRNRSGRAAHRRPPCQREARHALASRKRKRLPASDGQRTRHHGRGGGRDGSRWRYSRQRGFHRRRNLVAVRPSGPLNTADELAVYDGRNMRHAERAAPAPSPIRRRRRMLFGRALAKAPCRPLLVVQVGVSILRGRLGVVGLR
jgi:integrase